MTNTEQLTTLQAAYRKMLTDVCGGDEAAALPAANDALRTARLAQVTHAHSEALPAGEWVLVWDRGRTREGTKALVGWHPNFGIELFHQAQCYVEERS